MFRWMLMRTPLLALVLILGYAATPADAQETFQLAEVNGEALPALLEQEDDGCREELLSATLILTQGGEWSLVSTQQEICGDDTDLDEDEDSGTYAAQGDGLTFFDDDGDSPTADDDAEIEVEELQIGTRNGNELTVTLADGETELLFRP